MITVAVANGAAEGMLEVAEKAREQWKDELRFIVFDSAENIDTKNLWEYRQCGDTADAVRQAVESVKSKESDILMKGNVQTHVLLKEVLKKEHQLKSQTLLSHIALVHLPALNRPILLTDAGMNINPSKEDLIRIIENAIDTAHKIGVSKPKAALLSAAENHNPNMSSSVLAKEVTDHFARTGGAVVYGPLSLDLSLSKDAVQTKQFEGPVAGDADILVVPSIDAGNVLYKSFLLFADATIGGTIAGAGIPIVLPSRSDKLKSKLYSLEFALKQLKKGADS